MLTRDDATTRVAKGAAYLDQARPGWFNRIDVGTLTLHDPCGCIVGQLCHTGYDFAAGRIALGLSRDQGRQYGFDLWMDDSPTGRNSKTYQPLQDAWIAAIADRVLAAAQAHDQSASTNAIDPSADVLESVATRV